MDCFANDAFEKRDQAFEKTSDQLDLLEAYVEKDFWICWCLKQIFALPSFGDHIIFKGGTSLSKAYNVINRFSEDVDLSLDRARFGFGGEHDPAAPGLSNKKKKRLLSELQSEIEALVCGPLFSEIQSAFETSLKHDFSLTVDDEDSQTLLFGYPTTSDNSDDYVKRFVRLEFGARGVHLPARQMKITPYVHDVFPELLTTSAVNVKVLGIERTFWEKVTILHKLYHQDITGKPIAERMSRHYYDMAQLINHESKSDALEHVGLLEEVAHHNSTFFRAAWASYETAMPGTLRLMPHPDLATALSLDYDKMQRMFFGNIPDFSDILGVIETFEAEINS